MNKRGKYRKWIRENTKGDSPYLLEIKRLYNEGLSTLTIGRILNKDHTTILHHLRKFGIVKGTKRVIVRKIRFQPIRIPRPVNTPPPSPPPPPPQKRAKYDDLFDEPVNPGKSYEQYLRDSGKSEAYIIEALRIKRTNR